jgi:hypothetical protein
MYNAIFEKYVYYSSQEYKICSQSAWFQIPVCPTNRLHDLGLSVNFFISQVFHEQNGVKINHDHAIIKIE